MCFAPQFVTLAVGEVDQVVLFKSKCRVTAGSNARPLVYLIEILMLLLTRCPAVHKVPMHGVYGYYLADASAHSESDYVTIV